MINIRNYTGLEAYCVHNIHIVFIFMINIINLKLDEV